MGKYPTFVIGLIILVIVLGAVYSLGGGDSTAGGGNPIARFIREHPRWFILPSASSEQIATSSVVVPGGSVIRREPIRPPAVAASPVPRPVPVAVTPPEGFTVGGLSPLYQKVHLSSVDPVRSWPDVGGFTVTVDSSLEGTVNLTGWTVRSNKSLVVARIPPAVANYTPYGFSPGDILAGPGDYLVVRTTKGFVGNLRTNRCTGFLNGVYPFEEKLPENCPTLYDRSELVTLSGRCQSTITSFSGCRLPTSADYAAVGTLDGGACRALLNRFGYQGCYTKYAGTPDFFSHEWRIWLDVRELSMDPDHDRLLLLDRTGLLTDIYTY